jgi:hypothetical protein
VPVDGAGRDRPARVEPTVATCYEVTVQSRFPLIAATGLAALSLVGAAVAAETAAATTTPKIAVYIDQKYGYSIALPTDWYVIPRTKADLKTEIATLKKEKNTSLAAAYTSVLNSPVAVKQLSIYRFQAFLWPPLDSLVPTEANVEIFSGTYTTSTLAADALTFAHSLEGMTTTTPTRLKLAAGTSEFFQGKVAGTPSTGLEFYFFAHAKRLYILSFALGDAYLREAKIQTTLRAFAGAFTFKT